MSCTGDKPGIQKPVGASIPVYVLLKCYIH